VLRFTPLCARVEFGRQKQACVGNGRRLSKFAIGGGTGRRPSCARLTVKNGEKKKKKKKKTHLAHCWRRMSALWPRIVKKNRVAPTHSKRSVAVALHCRDSTRNKRFFLPLVVLRALIHKERTVSQPDFLISAFVVIFLLLYLYCCVLLDSAFVSGQGGFIFSRLLSTRGLFELLCWHLNILSIPNDISSLRVGRRFFLSFFFRHFSFILLLCFFALLPLLSFAFYFLKITFENR
jgi:hypothetical protein